MWRLAPGFGRVNPRGPQVQVLPQRRRLQAHRLGPQTASLRAYLVEFETPLLVFACGLGCLERAAFLVFLMGL